MSDCPNVEMREALPELLHNRLSVAHAARVREHVALCADCAAELELLDRAQRAYAASAPSIDTAAIVRALPVPATLSATRVAPRPNYSLGMLRLAAAIVLLLAGVFALRGVLREGSENGSDPRAIVVQPVDTTADTSDVAQPAVIREARSAEPRVLALALSDLDGLEAEELETMLAALDGIDAAPAAEPDTLVGSVRGIGSSEG